MTKKIRKVLVIEDNRPIAKALLIKLREKGYDVDVAYDGKEALTKLSNDHIDLFLLDLIMPEMDGFSFLEEINKKNIKAGVIVISNLSSKETIEKIKNLGVSDYLVKSDYKLEDMADKVDAYFQNK